LACRRETIAVGSPRSPDSNWPPLTALSRPRFGTNIDPLSAPQLRFLRGEFSIDKICHREFARWAALGSFFEHRNDWRLWGRKSHCVRRLSGPKGSGPSHLPCVADAPHGFLTQILANYRRRTQHPSHPASPRNAGRLVARWLTLGFTHYLRARPKYVIDQSGRSSELGGSPAPARAQRQPHRSSQPKMAKRSWLPCPRRTDPTRLRTHSLTNCWRPPPFPSLPEYPGTIAEIKAEHCRSRPLPYAVSAMSGLPGRARTTRRHRKPALPALTPEREGSTHSRRSLPSIAMPALAPMATFAKAGPNCRVG